VPFEFLMSALLMSQAAAAQNPVAGNHGNSPAYRVFLNDLQNAIRTNRREQVLRLIAYPLRVNVYAGHRNTSRTRYYRTPVAVRLAYAQIFNSRVRAAILNQRYETLFAPSSGIMIGNGEVWFNGICLDRHCASFRVRIVSINIM